MQLREHRRLLGCSIAVLILICGYHLIANYASKDHNTTTGISSNYNVKDFGARGNGTSDDTDAIQRALDTASMNKASLYFPSGTYLINPNRSLRITSNTRVAGAGASSIIKANNNTFGWSLIELSGTSIQISQLSFDGNDAVNRIIVVESGSSDIRITNSLIANASQSTDPSNDFYNAVVCGVIVYGNTDRVSIERTEIRNVQAIHPIDGSLVARGVYVTITWGSTEQVSTRFSITHSRIHDIGPADDGDGIYYEDPNLDHRTSEETNSTIADNLFVNCAKRAIKIYAQGILVTDNIILNNYLNNNYYQGQNKGTLAPDMYAGISIYADNNTITNNTLRGTGSYYAGIEIASNRIVKNIVVSGNLITMGAQSNMTDTTAISDRRHRGFYDNLQRIDQWATGNMGLAICDAGSH